MSWVDPERVAREWHWGGDQVPVHVVRVSDPDVPDPLIACGVWVSVTLASGQKLSCDDDGCFLAFDPNSDGGRLYFCLSPSVRRVARSLWRPGARVTTLERLAKSVGGTHTEDYPDVDVQPLGQVVQVEYFAKKYGDGAQDGAVFYHDHDAWPKPWLAVSEDGRLFYAGGSYDATDNRGIVG